MSTSQAVELLATCEGITLSTDEPLAPYTTYRIGGPADLMVCADTFGGLTRAMRILIDEQVPWVLLGRGSNVLVSDEGYRGCVVRLGREFQKLEVDGNIICAGAALQLTKLVNETITRELSGLECCAGVPGTVGGAVSMDAGTRHEWIGSCIRDIVTLRPGKGMQRYAGTEIEWGYRWCSIPSDEIILEATFELKPSTKQRVADEMNLRMARRRATQPTGRPCCGSVFRNPGDRSVGALLEACDVKGMRIGGARVSDKHANFILNEGGATAMDVLRLIDAMHSAVKERYDIDLVPEVKFLGFEG